MLEASVRLAVTQNKKPPEPYPTITISACQIQTY
jgi:hypothetical protein